ncbi:hypothetical protein [Kitasatospora sp. NPDC101183]|uniref:hypothetical protein n=1 Tax=Kitasatospora sp. NPDC101183 TaxID=3364100 RepID=UPI0038177E2C
MARRKWWAGRLFSIGYRAGDRPSIDPPKVGITVEVADGTQAGRMIDLNFSPSDARQYAEWLRAAADRVDEEIRRCAITRDAVAFVAERGGQ